MPKGHTGGAVFKGGGASGLGGRRAAALPPMASLAGGLFQQERRSHAAASIASRAGHVLGAGGAGPNVDVEEPAARRRLPLAAKPALAVMQRRGGRGGLAEAPPEATDRAASRYHRSADERRVADANAAVVDPAVTAVAKRRRCGGHAMTVKRAYADLNLFVPSNCMLLGYLGRIQKELQAVVAQREPLVPPERLLDTPAREELSPRGCDVPALENGQSPELAPSALQCQGSGQGGHRDSGAIEDRCRRDQPCPLSANAGRPHPLFLCDLEEKRRDRASSASSSSRWRWLPPPRAAARRSRSPPPATLSNVFENRREDLPTQLALEDLPRAPSAASRSDVFGNKLEAVPTVAAHDRARGGGWDFTSDLACFGLASNV